MYFIYWEVRALRIISQDSTINENHNLKKMFMIIRRSFYFYLTGLHQGTIEHKHSLKYVNVLQMCEVFPQDDMSSWLVMNRLSLRIRLG